MRKAEKNKFALKKSVGLDAIFEKLAAIENKIDKNTKKIENIEEKMKKIEKSDENLIQIQKDINTIKNTEQHCCITDFTVDNQTVASVYDEINSLPASSSLSSSSSSLPIATIVITTINLGSSITEIF